MIPVPRYQGWLAKADRDKMRLMELIRAAVICIVLYIVAAPALAHVPYLEEQDYSFQRPFLDLDVTQSIAVYAWLESDQDIDVYVCWVPEPSRLFVELLVPVCDEYESFFPGFAVVGPDLPGLSIPVGAGYRIQAVAWMNRSTPRETFYEPFGGKSYYQGPTYDQLVSAPGLYFVICWDPDGKRGDYVMPIGFEERWPIPAIIRAIFITPQIRRDEELHSPCLD
jgi:hypothetical protein